MTSIGANPVNLPASRGFQGGANTISPSTLLNLPTSTPTNVTNFANSNIVSDPFSYDAVSNRTFASSTSYEAPKISASPARQPSQNDLIRNAGNYVQNNPSRASRFNADADRFLQLTEQPVYGPIDTRTTITSTPAQTPVVASSTPSGPRATASSVNVAQVTEDIGNTTVTAPPNQVSSVAENTAEVSAETTAKKGFFVGLKESAGNAFKGVVKAPKNVWDWAGSNKKWSIPLAALATVGTAVGIGTAASKNAQEKALYQAALGGSSSGGSFDPLHGGDSFSPSGLGDYGMDSSFAI
jgi:hypothetical protein